MYELPVAERDGTEPEALAETLLSLPQDTFDDLDAFMCRLASQCGNDDTLRLALDAAEPGLVKIVKTLAYRYSPGGELSSVRSWLLYGWPILTSIYKLRKEN